MSKEKINETDEKAITEKLQREKILKSEEQRTSREKYYIMKVGKWIVLPWLLVISSFIYLGFEYFSQKHISWFLAVPTLLIGILLGSASEIEEEWEKRLSCKEEIHNRDSDYKWRSYSPEYVFTDSMLKYLVYGATFWITGFTLLAFVIILAISLIGLIKALAPTTIIIILLLIVIALLVTIIANQFRFNKR